MSAAQVRSALQAIPWTGGGASCQGWNRCSTHLSTSGTRSACGAGCAAFALIKW